MGLWDNSYLYAAPMPYPGKPWDMGPATPPLSPAITPKDAVERIELVMRKLDEFAIMQALDALPEPARLRVLEWLKKRCEP